MPPAAPTHRQRGGAPLLPAPGRRTGTAAGRPPDSSEMPQHAARSSGLRKSSDRILRATIRTSSLRERGFKSLCPSGKGQASHRTSPAELLGGWAASVPRHRAARRSPGSLRHTTPPPPSSIACYYPVSAPASHPPHPLAGGLGRERGGRELLQRSPVHPQVDGEEEKALASLGQLQAQLPGSGGTRLEEETGSLPVTAGAAVLQGKRSKPVLSRVTETYRAHYHAFSESQLI